MVESVIESRSAVAPLWRGVAVALVTFFDDDGAVDYAATASHAARLVREGIGGILVAGSTGEADALTPHERIGLVRAVKDACPDVPLLAGTSGAWQGPAVELTAGCVQVGADAVLVAPPRRGGDLVEYYAAVARAALGGAVLAYHFPGVAGGEVPLESLPALPVYGMKDSTGDPERLLRVLSTWDGWVYVGSSAVVGYASMLGATGAILAVANAEPADCLAAWSGDAAAQLRLVGPHLAAKARFPHGLKALVGQRFGTSTRARLG